LPPSPEVAILHDTQQDEDPDDFIDKVDFIDKADFTIIRYWAYEKDKN